LDKEKPDIKNIRDLNLAVVRHRILQVIELALQPEHTFMGHNMLNEPGLKEAQSMYYTYMNYRYITQ
jgi:hypothetical protein